MPKTFVIGDIHGAARALTQCLERAGFDDAVDHLICLGDICDGWPETREAIDRMLKIQHLTYVLGNHDLWAREWMEFGYADSLWVHQGGEATIASYRQNHIPPAHIKLLTHAPAYYLNDNRLFVHAGIDPTLPLNLQGNEIFLWDRNLSAVALLAYEANDEHYADTHITAYREVYLGHTPIAYPHPIQGCEIWLMDTGAGWEGVLSMMNIDTKEVFTSDPVPSLYPGVEGRKKHT